MYPIIIFWLPLCTVVCVRPETNGDRSDNAEEARSATSSGSTHAGATGSGGIRALHMAVPAVVVANAARDRFSHNNFVYYIILIRIFGDGVTVYCTNINVATGALYVTFEI